MAGLALSALAGLRAGPVPGSASRLYGEPFDAAPFGTLISDPDNKSLVVRWAEPRKIRRVVVEFPASMAPPGPRSVRLQYWHQSWDGRPDPILAEAGAGGLTSPWAA